MKFNSITLTIELIDMAQAMSKIKRTEQGREKFGAFVNPWNCLCKMVPSGVTAMEWVSHRCDEDRAIILLGHWV